MKLEKSKTGKTLIILYYAVFGTGVFLLMMFITSKFGIPAGLAAGLVLGVICGITGGELEFIEHRKTRRKKYTAGTYQDRDSCKEHNKVLCYKSNINSTRHNNGKA